MYAKTPLMLAVPSRSKSFAMLQRGISFEGLRTIDVEEWHWKRSVSWRHQVCHGCRNLHGLINPVALVMVDLRKPVKCALALLARDSKDELGCKLFQANCRHPGVVGECDRSPVKASTPT